MPPLEATFHLAFTGPFKSATGRVRDSSVVGARVPCSTTSTRSHKMGIMDDMKDKAEGLVDQAKDSAEGLKDKVPGADKADGLIEKAKGMLDKDGDGEVDLLEKAKGAAGGLFEKAKGLLHKD